MNLQMKKPIDGAEKSVAESGELESDDVTHGEMVVRDEHEQPIGYLMQSGPDSWFYSDITDLELLEPAHNTILD